MRESLGLPLWGFLRQARFMVKRELALPWLGVGCLMPGLAAFSLPVGIMEIVQEETLALPATVLCRSPPS